jgi:hypothetical protein
MLFFAHKVYAARWALSCGFDFRSVEDVKASGMIDAINHTEVQGMFSF